MARSVRTAISPGDWNSGRLKPSLPQHRVDLIGQVARPALVQFGHRLIDLGVDSGIADLAEVSFTVGGVYLRQRGQRKCVAHPAELHNVEVADADVLIEESVARLDVEYQLDTDVCQVLLCDQGDLPARWRVVEHVPDDELPTVFLPPRPVPPPAQRIQIPAGLFRVVSGWRAVVLVSDLADDINVIVQGQRVIGQAVLDDIDDRLTVDGAADRQAQLLVGEDRSGCPVEGEVIPGWCGRTANHHSPGPVRGDHVVEGAHTGGIDRAVLQRGDDGG